MNWLEVIKKEQKKKFVGIPKDRSKGSIGGITKDEQKKRDEMYSKGFLWCNSCRKFLPVEKFSKDKSNKYGVQCWCKTCFKEYQKEYRQKNKEKIKEYQKEYKQKNKERISLQKKEYQQKNKEKIKEYQKEYQKEYYKKNKERLQLYYYKKHDKRRGLFNTTDEYYTPKELLELFESGKCFWCGESDSSKLGLDRIDNSKGHSKSNVVVCCWDCNRYRGSIYTFEQMIEQKEVLRQLRKVRNKIL